MVFKSYPPKGTAYFVNKYDWKDCFDYNTSNSDVQKVCQMLSCITNRLENYNKYYVLSCRLGCM